MSILIYNYHVLMNLEIANSHVLIIIPISKGTYLQFVTQISAIFSNYMTLNYYHTAEKAKSICVLVSLAHKAIATSHSQSLCL